MELTLAGPDLPVRTAARRLRRRLGADEVPAAQPAPAAGEHECVFHDVDDGDDLRVDVCWYGPRAPGRSSAGGEAAVQALSGLMQVHGRDAGVPRRLGLEVASVAAGVLTSQAVLASLVGRARGRLNTHVETSVLEAALQLTSHYVAAATCRDRDEWRLPDAGLTPGPPFRSADGRWFEIETLDPDAWRRFWFALGAQDLDLSKSWTQFRSRYFRGACSLPPEVHEATARRTFDEVAATARSCRVSLAPVRSYTEVLAEPLEASELARIDVADAANHVTVARPKAIPSARPPLEGVRVVEATSRIQGPLAGLLLRMLGADVVRVEPPGGDPIRLVPPYAGADGYFFTAFNHGKVARELNLGTAAGRSDLLDLLSGADVFIQNWAPGKAEVWGLTAATALRAAPRLTYVELSGWGDSDRNTKMVGTEFLVQALSGLACGLSPDGEPPAPSRVLLVDCLGALVACEGALGGLLLAARSGRGSHVCASLMAGAMALQAHVLDALRDGDERSRSQGRPVWGDLDRPLRAADGFLAVDLQGGSDIPRLARALGAPARATTAEAELQIAARVRERAARECEETLASAGVAGAAVTEDLAGLASDPRFAHLFDDVADGCRVAATPWRFAA